MMAIPRKAAHSALLKMFLDSLSMAQCVVIGCIFEFALATLVVARTKNVIFGMISFRRNACKIE